MDSNGVLLNALSPIFVIELGNGIPSTSAADQEEQARNYRVVTDIMLNNDNCPNMLIWGIKDNDSWRSGSNPLLYTSSLGKKPAWYAVLSALRHRALVTDVKPMQAAVAPSDAIYDLKGRRIGSGSLKSGIYIKGGRKIVVR